MHGLDTVVIYLHARIIPHFVNGDRPFCCEIYWQDGVLESALQIPFSLLIFQSGSKDVPPALLCQLEVPVFACCHRTLNGSLKHTSQMHSQNRFPLEPTTNVAVRVKHIYPFLTP